MWPSASVEALTGLGLCFEIGTSCGGSDTGHKGSDMAGVSVAGTTEQAPGS
jgi:hypothetical protein